MRIPADQQPLRGTGRRAGGASSSPSGRPATGDPRSSCSAVTPASARPGWSASSSSGCRRAATTAARQDPVLRGDGVEQADGELPYAPLLSALRPLVRERHPALRRPQRRAAGSSWRRSSPASTRSRLAAHERPTPTTSCGCSRRCWSCIDLPHRGRAAGADPGGHALGRPLDAGLHRVPGPQPAPGARVPDADLPRATSCTAATRCGRCCPSSSASSARGGSSSRRLTATSCARR